MLEPNVLLFINGTVLTMNATNQVAEALAIVDDTILAVGSTANVRAALEKWRQESNLPSEKQLNVQTFDLKGNSIVPGFIDAHMHPAVFVYFKTQVDLAMVRSREDLRKKIQAAAQERKPSEWILGIDLMEDIFTDPKERTFPEIGLLDSICSTHPVLLLRHDGHICTVNSVAMAQIGVTKENVKAMTPPTGEIRLDNEGNPTGLFVEGATTLALDKLPIPSLDMFLKATKEFTQEMSSFGITTCGSMVQLEDEGMLGKAGSMEFPMLQVILKENIIKQDLVFYFNSRFPKKLKRTIKQVAKFPGNDTKFPRYVFGGIKIFADGTFGAHTCALYEPFNDMPEMKGYLVQPPEALYEIMREANELGLQIATHSIGDKGNATVVDLYNKLPPLPDHSNEPNWLRHRIEHVSILNPAILDAANKGKVVFVCQPAFINSEYTWLEPRLGKARCRWTYPFRSIIDAGILLAAASDAPVESASVVLGLDACVNRQGFIPDESITLIEAIKMFTINAAYSMHQEKVRGSLETGKIADFVIIEQNLLTILPQEIKNIQILQTYHRGERIF